MNDKILEIHDKVKYKITIERGRNVKKKRVKFKTKEKEERRTLVNESYVWQLHYTKRNARMSTEVKEKNDKQKKEKMWET